ncbi:MAG TPA: porin, partial [Patescibacteria group bacterium]|nr:porin [Patescibacteria group bacterium]
MKKVLFASAALIALGAGSAQAVEPVKLDIGGYMNQWVGYATNKDSAVLSPTQTGKGSAKVDVQDDVEIDFKGSTKLDNGLSVGVEVDTNGSQGRSVRSTGANGDGKRSFATVSGGFGALEVGEQDNVGALIHSGSPDVGGIGGQDGNFMNWVAAPAGHSDTRQRTYAGDDRTENKVIYITPAFHGLSAGVSYTPNIENSQTGHTSITSNFSNSIDPSNGQLAGDLYVYGLAYNAEFSGVTIKSDLGAGNANVAG